MPSTRRARASSATNTTGASKRQKTGAQLQSHSGSSSTSSETPNSNENAPGTTENLTSLEEDEIEETSDACGTAGCAKRDPNEYVCIPRPLFDYELEARVKEREKLERNQEDDPEDEGNEDEEEDEERAYVRYSEEFNKMVEKKMILSPASKHKDWKWVAQLSCWDHMDEYRRRSMYCDPDMFQMYIYNDWKAYGTTELLQTLIAKFDKEITKKGGRSLHQMWAIISATGHWLNSPDSQAFIQSDDGDGCRALTKLTGYGLLTALSALEHAGQLKPDSEFLDLALVITCFLEWVHDLPAYGIDGNDVAWASHAVEYFKKAKLDPERGISGTSQLLEACAELIEDEEDDGPKFKRTDQDPWSWRARLKHYSKDHGKPTVNASHYDITKMSRALRATHAFSNKDPLADVSDKDLKAGLLDFQGM